MTADVDLSTWRAQVRAWLERETVPDIGRGDAALAPHRAWHRRLAAAGLLGVDWPRDCGGQGLSPMHQMVVMEELARRGAPFPLANVSLYVVGPTLVTWGTAEQKRRYLPPLLSGEEMWCQGFSEPDAGSDLASLRTRATRDGDDFVVNGQKIWTTHARYAEFCALMTRTDPVPGGHKGLTYFIVDMKSPGIVVRPIRQITGEAEFNEVFFDNVRVPAGNIIGGPGIGWQVAMRSLANERSVILVQRKSQADAVFRHVVAKLREARAAAEAPLAPELAARIGHAQMQLAALDAQVRAMAARLQTGEDRPGQESVDKLLLTEVEQEVFSLAFDLLGPYRQVPSGRPFGLDAERLIPEFFYSRSYSISAGTTQIQRNIVAQRVLGLPRSS